MWHQPDINEELIDMARRLDCSWLGEVQVDPDLNYDYDNCHNNVLSHVTEYGGDRVIGYYFLSGFGTIQAIRHSVWHNYDSLVDITPYRDSRQYIVFGISKNQEADYTISNCYSHSLAKYMQEGEVMYYVYQLVDPRDNQPFYIGKGKGRRAYSHLRENPDTRNQYKENKIAAIRKDGYEPIVEMIAENIIDEGLAYSIEEQLIARYGRKGYEKNGILTNVCPNSRPPNHRGKTYEEIYGDRADEQRQLRARIQKAQGGYGPKTHTNETKKKISERISNLHANRDCSHSEKTKIKISEAKKGKKNYTRTALLYIEGLDIFLYRNELEDFCKENNYSCGTFKKQLAEGWPASRKGKNKGLKVRYASETEITSYVDGGGVKKDSLDSLKGFEL